MAPTPSLFHTLLRPSILQILRAQGYHATRITVVDSLTDMASRYLFALCQATALHVAHNGDDSPSVVDVRMALQDCGAFLPEAVFEEQEWLGREDEGAVADFTKWFQGPRNREIRRIAMDGDDENTDYLMALKKKHSKAEEDSKYNGTVLGKGTEHGEIAVEGGELSSIRSWQDHLSRHRQMSPLKLLPIPAEEESRPPSSGLSSLGDRTIGSMAEEMNLS